MHAHLVFKNDQAVVVFTTDVPDGATVRHQDGRLTPGDQVQAGDVIRIHDLSFRAVDEVS
jgi:hypothetical protein